jgi:hypothetical protein
MTLQEYFVLKGKDALLPGIYSGNTLSCFNLSTSGDLLSAANTDPCLVALVSNEVINMTDAEVNNLAPNVVFGILKYLGFQMQDKNGKNVVQSYDSWVSNERIVKLNQAAGQKWIGSPLCNKLVNYINSRPKILNKGSSSKVEDLRKIGLYPARPGSNPPINLSNMRGEIDLSLNRIMFAIRPFVNAIAGPYAGYTGLGGSMVLPVGVMPSRRSTIDNLPEYTKQLEKLYNGFVSRLKSNGKTLSPHTVKQVKEVFDSASKKEAEVKNLLKYFDAYARTSTMSGDRAPRTITDTDLKSAYNNLEKTTGKYRRRLSALLDIATVTGTAANDAAGVNLHMEN